MGIAAVEFALWDLACKEVSLPLWRYLGPCRESVKAYSTDGGWLTWSQDELVADAQRLVARGFDAVLSGRAGMTPYLEQAFDVMVELVYNQTYVAKEVR